MFYLAVFLLLPCVFGARLTDPVTAFDHHVNQETERMWVKYDYNQNGEYDRDDAHQFIRDYDNNGDGKVTKMEFDFHWNEDEPTMIIVGESLFLEYDDNQDGEITAHDIDAQYDRMDKDKDGEVDKKEFKEYYHQLLTVLFILQTQHIENSGTTTP